MAAKQRLGSGNRRAGARLTDAVFLFEETLVMDVGHMPTASSQNILQKNQKEAYTDFF